MAAGKGQLKIPMKALSADMPARSEEALDIADEYNNALGAQSNARFLANKHVPEEEMEGLLKRQHELIPPRLQNAMRHRSTSSEIELALAAGLLQRQRQGLGDVHQAAREPRERPK
ncbi:hypothetical protein EJB05_38014, partial [Eragrostis curvula]